MPSQAEIDYWLQTVIKVARKEQAVLLAASRNTWLWRMKTPPPPPKLVSTSTLSKLELLGLPRLMAADVGVGEDWSHFYKRRRRARKEKVQPAILEPEFTSRSISCYPATSNPYVQAPLSH
ncbi:hypothetical protein EDD22DRAFT_374077 [Suillus occidentalis]|nr:hypothetical protein EDD22DRAFT_374077 [Suillus occidentalis]